MRRPWTPGEPLLLRNVRKGAAFYAAAALAVEDDGERLSLLVDEGHEMASMEGDEPRDFVNAYFWKRWTWGINRVRWFVQPGDAFMVGAFWRLADGRFLGWYVNLQEPMRRTELGIDTMDMTLDLEIHPNLRDWRWKDEDEFEYGKQHGWYSDADESALREAGRQALNRARSREWPFGLDIAGWLPDPTWGRPALPDGWDHIGLA